MPCHSISWLYIGSNSLSEHGRGSSKANRARAGSFGLGLAGDARADRCPGLARTPRLRRNDEARRRCAVDRDLCRRRHEVDSRHRAVRGRSGRSRQQGRLIGVDRPRRRAAEIGSVLLQDLRRPVFCDRTRGHHRPGVAGTCPPRRCGAKRWTPSLAAVDPCHGTPRAADSGLAPPPTAPLPSWRRSARWHAVRLPGDHSPPSNQRGPKPSGSLH